MLEPRMSWFCVIIALSRLTLEDIGKGRGEF